MYILGVIAVLLTALFIVLRVTKGGVIALYAKTVASVAFLSLGLYGAYLYGLNLVSLFIILGLLCGLLGDIVLDLKVVYNKDENMHLNAGMTWFGVGHFCYFVALFTYVSNNALASTKNLALILIALGISLFVTSLIMLLAKPLLKLDFKNFKFQTALYTFALSFMTAYSIAVGTMLTNILIFASGLFLIFASDLILSNQYFGGKQNSKLLTTLNHAIYYLGQITIAVMIFFL